MAGPGTRGLLRDEWSWEPEVEGAEAYWQHGYDDWSGYPYAGDEWAYYGEEPPQEAKNDEMDTCQRGSKRFWKKKRRPLPLPRRPRRRCSGPGTPSRRPDKPGITTLWVERGLLLRVPPPVKVEANLPEKGLWTCGASLLRMPFAGQGLWKVTWKRLWQERP